MSAGWDAALAVGLQPALGLLGAEESNKWNKKAAELQYQRQKEFAQHGVRWRVEDAKAAGLHPLYALGAQTSAYQPVMVQDSVGPALAEAGQSIGNAIARQETDQQRRANELQLQLLQSQIHETDARRDFILSEAARNRQGAVGSPAFPAVDDEDPGARGAVPHWVNSFPKATGGIPYGPDLQPYVQTDRSFSRAISAESPTPMWRRFRLSGGDEMILPTSSADAAEALESISESYPLMWAVYQENKAVYGEARAERIAERYFVPDAWTETKRWFKNKADEWHRSDRSQLRGPLAR